MPIVPHMLALAVLNQKGGAGKSVLATNLAAAAHLSRKRSIILDLDKQGSALDWFAARSEDSQLTGLITVKVDKALSPSQFRQITDGYEVAVLDAPSKLSVLTRAAAVSADLLLIPVQPGPFDMWSAEDTLELLDEADEIRSELGKPAARRIFVINRATRTVMSRKAPKALAEKGEVSSVVIHQRIAFSEAAAVGESVLTHAPNSPAAQEIRDLYKFIIRRARRSRRN